MQFNESRTQVALPILPSIRIYIFDDHFFIKCCNLWPYLLLLVTFFSHPLPLFIPLSSKVTAIPNQNRTQICNQFPKMGESRMDGLKNAQKQMINHLIRLVPSPAMAPLLCTSTLQPLRCCISASVRLRTEHCTHDCIRYLRSAYYKTLLHLPLDTFYPPKHLFR